MGNLLCCFSLRATKQARLDEKAYSPETIRTRSVSPSQRLEPLYIRDPLLNMEPTKEPFTITLTLTADDAPREFQMIHALMDTEASVNIVSEEFVRRHQILVEKDEEMLRNIQELNKRPYPFIGYFFGDWRLQKVHAAHPGLFAVSPDSDIIPPDIDVLLKPVKHTDHVGSATGETTSHALRFRTETQRRMDNGGRDQLMREYQQMNASSANPQNQQNQQVQTQQNNGQEQIQQNNKNHSQQGPSGP